LALRARELAAGFTFGSRPDVLTAEGKPPPATDREEPWPASPTKSNCGSVAEDRFRAYWSATSDVGQDPGRGSADCARSGGRSRCCAPPGRRRGGGVGDPLPEPDLTGNGWACSRIFLTTSSASAGTLADRVADRLAPFSGDQLAGRPPHRVRESVAPRSDTVWAATAAAGRAPARQRNDVVLKRPRRRARAGLAGPSAAGGKPFI
jgi:hypothetical protein